MYKFTVKAYNDDDQSNVYFGTPYGYVNDSMDDVVIITVKALSESEAVDKSKDLVERNSYQVISIEEE